MYLEQINKVNDIKKIDSENLSELAKEIREFLVEKVSNHGGHLSSNLGVVELTMALHRSFDPSVDRLLWDVGHQCYTHKLLTGRKEGFDSLREYGGMSGFPKTKESVCDVYDSGHSSNSLSVGLGLVTARDLSGSKEHVVAVIGDGALTGGMAFEALNNAAKLETNFIIVLNDNEMSISKNVGGLSTYLEGIRTATPYQQLKEGVWDGLEKIPVYGTKIAKKVQKTKNSIKSFFVPGMFFEDMGITYLGPVDGHNIAKIEKSLEKAKRVKGPVIVHVITKKGKGYLPAEKHPSRFHGIGAFDSESGQPLTKKTVQDYTDVFAGKLINLAKDNKKVVAVTAAMEEGTGLSRFHKEFPNRFFDVGIAEEHAVSFCAGLAMKNFVPVFAVYSSFLQRAYDQILEDVCLNNLHVVFAIDRAGLVGKDGETHQGVFDLSYLLHIPNMTVLSPKNKWEFLDMLSFAVNECEGPVAIRYPRGSASCCFKENREEIKLGKAEILEKEKEVLLLALGSMVEKAGEVKAILKEKGISSSLVNMRFAKPFDRELVEELCKSHKLVVTLEENVVTGGLGRQIMAFVATLNTENKVINLGLPEAFIEQGEPEKLLESKGLSPDKIAEDIEEALKEL